MFTFTFTIYVKLEYYKNSSSHMTACGWTEFLQKDGLRICDFASDKDELRKCGEIDYGFRSDGDFRNDDVFRGNKSSSKNGQRS